MPGYQKKKKEPYNQKTAVLTEEEQALRAENLLARENFCHDGVKHLGAAICLQAIHDYPKALRKLRLMEDIAKGRAELLRLRDPRGRKANNPSKFEEELKEIRDEVADFEDFFDSELFVGCTGLSGKQEAIKRIMKLQPETLCLIERRLMK